MTFASEDTRSGVRDVLADLIVATNRLTRVAARATGNTVSPAVWRTISVLQAQGPMRLGELAAETRVSQPTATKLVRNLDELEWIKRVQDPSDARAWQLAAAPKGVAALEAWRGELTNALEPLFGDLTDEEADCLRLASRLLEQRVTNASDLERNRR